LKQLKLEVDVGKKMDYKLSWPFILIGRDWQEGFKLIFDAERMIIKGSELA